MVPTALSYAKYLILAALLSTLCLGQTDEIRQATGLPIPIGSPVIYGRVTLKGLGDTEVRPSVVVTLMIGGVQIDRRPTNDSGYYYFLAAPRDGSILLFEVNNNEIGRMVLTPGIGNTLRQDISVDWKTLKQQSSTAAVVSADELYIRSAHNESIFRKALTARTEKHNDAALELLKQIVSSDEKDFVAWTELGTLYFESGELKDGGISYEKALALKPDYIVALMNLGKLQLSQKDPGKAAVSFFNAVRAHPGSADAYHYLGESYLQLKQGSKAVIALNEAIRLAPTEKAPLHLRLAALYVAAGLKDRAAKEYKLFLEKMPNYPDREKLEKFIKENYKSLQTAK